VDVWAAGCILFEVATGKVLFEGRNDRDQLNTILRVRGVKHETERDLDEGDRFSDFLEANLPEYMVGLKDLLLKMLAWDPKARISARTALQHELFRDHIDPWELPRLFLAEAHQRRKKRARRICRDIGHRLHRIRAIVPPLCV
jgi:serine/threonine protein kinase